VAAAVQCCIKKHQRQDVLWRLPRAQQCLLGPYRPPRGGRWLRLCTSSHGLQQAGCWALLQRHVCRTVAAVAGAPIWRCSNSSSWRRWSSLRLQQSRQAARGCSFGGWHAVVPILSQACPSISNCVRVGCGPVCICISCASRPQAVFGWWCLHLGSYCRLHTSKLSSSGRSSGSGGLTLLCAMYADLQSHATQLLQHTCCDAECSHFMQVHAVCGGSARMVLAPGRQCGR